MAKKDVKTGGPKVPEKPVSNVRSYFTKEINEQIAAMSMGEMEALMKDMPSSRSWIALLKFTNIRTSLLDSQLRATNPVTDPHSISWAQGALAGLCDIESYVIDLNSPKSTTAEEPKEEGSPEGGVIIG